MTCRVYAQGRHRDGQPFLYEFETKRDAQAWAAQNKVVIRRLVAVYSHDQPAAQRP